MSRSVPSTRLAAASEPNVTPMLDVLLVLLVLFMVLAVRDRRTMDAQLPQPCAGVCEAGGQVVLEVLPGPTYRLNHEPVPAAALEARLRATYAPRREKIIQVVGDPTLAYQDIIDAMDAARGAGVRVVGLPSRETASRPR